MIVRRVTATVLLPWRTATFLLKPRVGPLRGDRVLDRLAFWRAAAGLFVIVIVNSQWQSTVDVLADVSGKTLRTAGYAMTAVPLPFLVLLAATRPGHRAQLLRGALRLLGRAVLASVGLVLLFGVLIVVGGRHGPPRKPVDLLPFAGALVGICWLVVLVACSLYWAARTGFWLSEVHPLLAPAGTTFVMLVLTGQELVAFDTGAVPAPFWLTLNLCGVVTALVLAICEYRHLRSIGYRFRTGPRPGTGEGARARVRARAPTTTPARADQDHDRTLPHTGPAREATGRDRGGDGPV